MPWVPRDLYDLMVNALRERGAVVSPVVPVVVPPTIAPVEASKPSAGVVVSEAPALPARVAQACYEFAFGNAAEEAANVARATVLHKAGKTPAEIVADIRQGAPVDAMFV